MDKLKGYIAALRKHHFWVLCGLILIVGVTTWMMATKDLQARFSDNMKKLKDTDSLLTALGNEQTPNLKIIEGLDKEQLTLKQQVFEAWKALYDKQSKPPKQEAKPAAADDKAAGKEAAGKEAADKNPADNEVAAKETVDKEAAAKGEQVAELKAITVWPEPVQDIGKLGPDEQIPQALRQQFMDTGLKTQWDRIVEKVQPRHPKHAVDPNNPMGNDKHIEYVGLVVWDQTLRDDILRRYQVNFIPSDRRVRVTQEDMWVYQSLVELVRHLNEVDTHATDSLNAVIRKIDVLDVAQWAIQDAQKTPGAEIKLKKEDEATAAAGPLGDEGIVKLPGDSESKDDNSLVDGRYLDENMQPITAEAALKNPPFAEFKQMFVNMQFVMDQRKIPELLAACANSPLRIEPRQVLLHFTDIDSSTPPGQEAPVANAVFEHSPYDAVVQIRAIAYLYNEPKEDKQGTGSAPKPAQRLLGIPQIKKEAPLLSPPAENNF